MPTFTPTTRTNNEYNAVYIRLSHKSATDYIKTSMVLHKSGIKKGKIADFTILANCANLIKSYLFKINDLNIDGWSVKELKEFLTNDTKDISFSNFSIQYIEQMQLSGRRKPAANYRTALNSLENFLGKKLLFSDITSKNLKSWIKSLENTARAKEMYPNVIKKLFDEGCFEYNDYENNIFRISHQPFKIIDIPTADLPGKRNLDKSLFVKLLNVKATFPREMLAQDMITLAVCLAGINTVDLYNLEKYEYRSGKLCYNRSKEENVRKDKAYFEITVPQHLHDIFERYKGKNRLFNFHEQYADADNFSRAVNKGIRSLLAKLHIENSITYYSLRHMWATVAKNECGATTEQVAFSLNHVSAHKVTVGYIEKDFSTVDYWNEKVIEAMFCT